jgi:hypothetical protein
MREHPDHHDAELLLRLYDLRREEKLRQAREWFMGKFQATTLEEMMEKYPPGSQENAYQRMAASYWDMAASVVLHGLINEEFFFENTAEFWIVWQKLKPLAPAARQAFHNPFYWKQLETLSEKYEKWMAGRAPDALEALRKRLAGRPSATKG